MQRLWRNNGLSIVLLSLFLFAWLGQTLTGHRHENQERSEHGQPTLSLSSYVRNPAFMEATAENWESEFLQMAAYVWFTVFLFQKGSSESKDPDKAQEEVDREPDPTRAGAPWPVRRGGLVLALYKRSLALTLLLLFAVSFFMHALGGAGTYNEAQAMHGEVGRVSVFGYMTTSQFWFESLQNWQSEFLAVLSIVVLSIFLRQHGSPESKPVDAANRDTAD